LLYGSNAIGGVVNTITSRDNAPEQPRGYLTGFGGTTSDQAGRQRRF
jgi:outer membrane cobalamin receptor